MLCDALLCGTGAVLLVEVSRSVRRGPAGPPVLVLAHLAACQPQATALPVKALSVSAHCHVALAVCPSAAAP